MDIFPEEVWLEILMNIPCYKLTEIMVVSKQFYTLINDNNLLEKRKFKGYPRESGYCKVHDVFDFDDLPELNIDNGIDFDELHGLINPALPSVLWKLYQLDYDLVRGDLICFIDKTKLNAGIYIFDGSKIINLNRDDPEEYNENGLLPLEFTVITNGVPITYWKKNGINEGLIGCHYVWLDPISIHNQLIENMKIETVIDEDNFHFLYTYFTINNKSYIIIINFTGFNLQPDNDKEILQYEINQDRESFLNKISNNEKILLDFNDDYSDYIRNLLANFDHVLSYDPYYNDLLSLW